MTTPSIPSIQRGWLVTQRGSPASSLRQSDDIPVRSSLSKGDVLVKIRAAALNPVGAKVMKYIPNFVMGRPTVPEYDFSGTIADGGDTSYNVGDAVYGMLEPLRSRGQGTLCQYITVSANNIVPKPEEISFEDAAGVALAAATAYNTLVLSGQLEEGQNVFVNGGSSSVGSFAIQIAKSKGCRVTTTASTKKIEMVKKLGADEVIDYTKLDGKAYQHFSSSPPSPRFNVIYDAIGDEPWRFFINSEKYLAPGGVFLQVGAALPSWSEIPGNTIGYARILFQPAWLGGVNRKWRYGNVGKLENSLPHINNLIREGKVKPLIDSVYEFGDVVAAYDRILTERAAGKIIIKIPS